ncbi:MND1-interacting protein 1-like [Impatiens glandulifera]|uniref:MND1-interacting protein 1-like n=1 Tax=Impatiens glandulifera TaxID=253017 RepID=UPI001FB089F1|nr:MND1-interacting protein 1-like [Impatiens glandulifera]
MPTKGRHKNRRQSVPVAADSGSTKLGTDHPRKNSTLTPDWVKCTKEEQLDIIIRKKLNHLYREALSTLVSKGYDENVALKGLLEMGYCVGETDCLSNVVQNSSHFLTSNDVELEEDRPQPFKNLELLVEFNQRFLVYILQKYRPNLNRISIRQCILMTNLNLNRAIIMNINDMPFVVTEMPTSDLNLEDDNGEIDGFLALEIRELLNNLNILDASVSEDMKDAMIAGLQKPIDDLMPQLQERIRWARKKVAQARRNQPSTIMSREEEIQVFEYFLESMLANKKYELSSLDSELDNEEETLQHLEMEKEEIKAEISASKLIESETKQKCLQVSKKKNWERQKVKLQEEIELEKEKMSKLKQQLVEIDAAIIRAQVKFDEVTKTRKAAATQFSMENRLVIDCWKPNALKLLTNEEFILGKQIERLKKLLTKALIDVAYELKACGPRDKILNSSSL